MKRWKVTIRQSLFGVFFGAIPGVGAAVIDWLSYALGIFFTRDPRLHREFGKGSLDGVLFAEAAQNSKEAGQGLVTLSIGVPGGVAWAIVLAAMLTFGISPGPGMLGRDADITILLIITLAIGNLLVTLLGIAFTGYLAKLTLIPYPLVGGVVIPIAFLSGLVSMTSWLALPIVLVFAGIGIIMKLFQWPRPPLLLGIVLGPIIEFNLQTGLNIYGVVGALTRPISIVLAALAVAITLFFVKYAPKMEVSGADLPTPGGGADNAPADTGAPFLDRLWRADNIPPLLMIGGASAMLWAAVGFVPEAAVLPKWTGGGVIVLAVTQLILQLRKPVGKVDIMDLGMRSVGEEGSRQAGLILAGILLFFLVGSGLVPMKWLAVTSAGLIPLTLMRGRNRYIGAGITALLVFLFVWFLMDQLIAAVWPEPSLIPWLGEHVF